MATTVSFNNMLNQYLPEPLLMEELKKRDWLLKNVEQDNSWLGGTLIIPFLGAVGSSISFGSLTSASDIAEEVTVRGQISAYKEVFGSMIFNSTDIMQHGKVSEQNFLRILPDAVKRHVEYFRGAISQSLLTGAYVAKATADGTAGGLITVAQPDRFQIGQKVSVDDDNSAPVTGYVRFINLNSGVLTIYDARSAGAVVDLSGYTVAQNAVLYQDGQQSNGFTDLRQQLLSLANGGSTNLFGVAKTAYPFLQAINVSGAAITAANILSEIFKAYVTIRRLGRGSPFNVVMSYKNYGACLSNLDSKIGSFNVIPGSEASAQYAWDEITIGGFAGKLKLIAVQEMDDDIIFFLDMSTIKFYTNGGIQRMVDPDGNQYTKVRNTTGFQYIVDHCLFGDMALIEPLKNGIMYSISYSL